MNGTMKRRYPVKNNILLVNITRLGDMLQATPTIAGMKMENPNCRITVLVEKQFEGVCHCIPGIDEVVTVDLGMTVRSMTRGGDGILDAYEYVSELVDDLRSRNFDYCLNMSSSGYTAMLLNLVGIQRRGGWTADDEGYRVIESEWAQLFASSVFHQNRQFNSLNLVDVFRCSADVEQHPYKLQIATTAQDRSYCEQLLREAEFTNSGPLIAIQAGASQGKRQWAPARFAKLIDILLDQLGARIVLTGTKAELAIIEPIVRKVDDPNVLVVAGRTNIPQLAAMLELSDILVTGDTGPMHISVAVGTPVVSMFLASAFGYETGPYSEGNIILQPVIGCGPCNPNKSCARPDCHDHIDPRLVAELTARRLQGPLRSVDSPLADPGKVIVYQSSFDEWGFCDLRALNVREEEYHAIYRQAYRRLWLEDIGGYRQPRTPVLSSSMTRLAPQQLLGLEEVIQMGKAGQRLIQRLERLILDTSAPPAALGVVNEELSDLDRSIERLGYHYAHLGPLTRMFVFAKENLSGSEAIELASQMGRIYAALERRGRNLREFLVGPEEANRSRSAEPMSANPS